MKEEAEEEEYYYLLLESRVGRAELSALKICVSGHITLRRL